MHALAITLILIGVIVSLAGATLLMAHPEEESSSIGSLINLWLLHGALSFLKGATKALTSLFAGTHREYLNALTIFLIGIAIVGTGTALLP